MISLHRLLSEAGINSKITLRSYIERYQAGSPDFPIKVVTAADLRLDGESRVYLPHVEIEDAVVDVPILRIQNSSKVSFNNCLFTGGVEISQKESLVEDIHLDTCLLMGSLTVVVVDQPTISLYAVSASAINLDRVHSNGISLVRCAIGYLSVVNCSAPEFYTFSNRFVSLNIAYNNFHTVRFSHTQVDLWQQPATANREEIEQVQRRFDVFGFPHDLNLDELDKIEQQTVHNATLEFLASCSDVSLDRRALGQLKYLQTLASQPNWAWRSLQRLIGGMVKPLRIMILAVVVWVLFALMFALPVCTFSVAGADGESAPRALNLAEALYYSGITFTTIGYGDITPIDWTRFLAVIEGVLGIVLMSSFLISLVRKYIE